MTLRALLALLMVMVLSPIDAQAQKELDPENTIYLDLKDGRVTIEMYPAFAPKTVERIKILTRRGFYDNLAFHRVSEGFMAQTGDPSGDGTGGSDLPDLEAEFNIKPHWRGATSMARSDDLNSANSQFFIMFVDKISLNGEYTVWGRVVGGMIYVDNIKKGDPSPELDGKVLGEPDRIIRMRVMADVIAEEAPPSEESTEENTEESTEESAEESTDEETIQ